jgi:hypothetical protein
MRHPVMVDMFSDIMYYLAGFIFRAESRNSRQLEELTKGGDLHKA